MRKLIFITGIVLSLILLPAEQASGGVNYPSYTYDEWEESVAAPDSYTAEQSVSGIELGCGTLKDARDLFISRDGTIYVADSGNNRLLILNRDLILQETIDTVLYQGKQEPLTDPQGLYVSEDGTMYIAQTSLGRILKVKNKEVVGTIEKPVHSLIGADFNFQPSKISVDTYGRAYVLSKGCYSGLLQYNADGNFMDFYGANKVEVTAKVVFQYLWKGLLSDAQREAMTSILPIEYSNIDCAADGFVYTATVGTETSVNQIKKLNPTGKNTYLAVGKKVVNFGDYEISFVKGTPVQAAFIDLKVDQEGFIFGLDLAHGRIIERDQEGNLIAVFGGNGKQLGTFSAPAALDVYDESVYVLDSLKGNITRFEPTEYEQLVREAVICYTEGRYEESARIWEQVRKRNGNNTLAYIGKGKALTQTGDYNEAMIQLRAGGERFSYSKAFSKNRLQIIRTYAPAAVAVLLLMVVVGKGCYYFHHRKKGGRSNEAGS